jgi:hypothetical protein
MPGQTAGLSIGEFGILIVALSWIESGWFVSAHEGTHEFAIGHFRDLLRVVSSSEKFPRLIRGLDPRRLDFVLEAGLCQFRAVVGSFEGSCNAAGQSSRRRRHRRSYLV